MRLSPTLLALLLLLVAGCTAEPAPHEETPPAPPAPPLPDPLHLEGTMPPSVDPNGNGQPNCSSPGTTCISFPLAIERPLHVSVRLRWEQPSNDLDLYLMKDSEVLAASRDFNVMASAVEALRSKVTKGGYTLVVLGASSGTQPFTLDVDFADP